MKKITSPKTSVLFAILLLLHFPLTTLAGISFIPGQGIVLTGADGIVLTGADGLVLTGADGIVLTGADGIVLTGADGIVLTGADGLVLTGADGIVLTGADANTYTRPYGIVLTGADMNGIRSLDPELALMLDTLPDSSAINVFVVFHRMPTASDLNALRAKGILGGTRFRNLPMVMVHATRTQIADISELQSVRSIYYNKTCEFFTHDTRVMTGQSAVMTDRNLTTRNGGLPLSGRGVTVAVLDTGIDATHPDLGYGTQVAQNIRIADLQGSAPDFLYPTTIEGMRNSDLTMGHGTFVASLIAGLGSASGGYYGGLAPGARLLGVSGGDASLFFVLSGMDYILSNRVAQNIRVVNCSFGIDGLFDAHDPVNIATKILHDAGISVVFSSGNRGDQPGSLNPYSVAPWVIGVGSATKRGTLSSFSSCGSAGYGIYHPTLVAPGEAVIGARAFGVNVVGTAGLAAALTSQENDLRNIPPAHLARYTMSSGTSFAAPHVSATIALMLQANPQMTPDQIKDALQETATPMLGSSRYEVGAGHLNTHAAVRKAAFGLQFGGFRRSLNNSLISYSQDDVAQFTGEVAPGASYTMNINIPVDAVFASIEVAWVRAQRFPNAIDVKVQQPNQTYVSKAPVMLAGKGLQKTGVSINNPAAGNWSITVTNASNTLAGSVQGFVGAIEIIRANYGQVTGIEQLELREQQAVKQALRTGLLSATSEGFDATRLATRLEVARAIMLGAGARVPQYLPYSPSFTDVTGDEDAVVVESITRSPRGNLMAAAGTQFNPQGQADRLLVAIAVVKALGLEQQAQAASATNPGINDWNSIPEAARGYVALAVTNHLMSVDRASGSFRPFDSITRVELGLAAAALQQATR